MNAILHWDAAPGASAYELYLWPMGEARPGKPLATGITGASYRMPSGFLDPDSRYAWQVVAINRTGKTDGPGDWNFKTGTPSFLRGDLNTDGTPNITDAIFALSFLFLGGEEPRCVKTGDLNDDGFVNITDTIYLLSFLFLGEEAPKEPFFRCGHDQLLDELTCGSYEFCGW